MILSPKQMGILTISLVILGGTTIWGLKGIISMEPLVLSTKAEASEGPLKLIVTIDKTNFEVGEEVNLTIQIVNISNSTIELLYGTPYVCPPIRFIVYDQDGAEIFGSGTHVLHMGVISYNKGLEPEEGLGVIKHWRQTQYALVEGVGWRLRQVPPEEYQITVEVIQNALQVYKYVNGVKVDCGRIYLKTPTLTITISK